jgi:putative endonuclease
MTRRNILVGKKGEDIAAGHLARQGYAIRGRNVRTPFGELDLVVTRGGWTVFVEVKTRRSRTYGLPQEAVTARKKRRLAASARHYLQENGISDSPWRIDVVAVECDGTGTVERIEVFENAVTG